MVAGFGRRLLGSLGVLFASAAVMFSVFGALNGNLLVAPRLLYAMGEDGLAPRALGAVHPRFHTPARAILVMAGWSTVLVLASAALMRFPLPILDPGFFTLDLNPPPGKALFDILTDFAMFGALSLYGYTTRRDLSGFGTFLFMGLIGIIIASLVNLFLRSTGLDWLISVIGVGVFAGLTAYDTQRIKAMYDSTDDEVSAGRKSVIAALSLYLNFINLFMMLLRLAGGRR